MLNSICICREGLSYGSQLRLPLGVRTPLRFGDCREGDASSQLEPKDDAVCMLLDDAPDLAGITGFRRNGSAQRGWCGKEVAGERVELEDGEAEAEKRSYRRGWVART